MGHCGTGSPVDHPRDRIRGQLSLGTPAFQELGSLRQGWEGPV